MLGLGSEIGEDKLVSVWLMGAIEIRNFICASATFMRLCNSRQE